MTDLRDEDGQNDNRIRRPTADNTISEDGSGKNHEDDLLRVPTELNPSPNRFRIKRKHGSGGFGLVWVADDIELGREVAIKELKWSAPSDEATERFKFEARITGYLDHPGVHGSTECPRHR